MDYWIVKPTDIPERIEIVCPLCDEWYEIPSGPYEIRCYRHCPWCGAALFVEEKYRSIRKEGVNDSR